MLVKVSVLMGVYNGSQTIQKAIQSIVEQDFFDWELIICDDASTDDTWKVLSLYCNNPKIIVIKNDKNRGLGYSLNQCLKLSNATYVARMDADDISRPNRLKVQIEYMESNSEVDVLGTYAKLFDDTGSRWGAQRPLVRPALDDWIRGSCIIHASVVMKRKKLMNVGGYDPKALRIEDYDLWLRMLHDGCHIQTLPLELYDIHWTSEDYNRKKNKYRLLDFKYRLKHFWVLNVPFHKYYWAFKPILLMLIPKFMLFIYHSGKMVNDK